MDLGGQRFSASNGVMKVALDSMREATTDLVAAPPAYDGAASEVYTADERPGVVLLRQGRYTIQLDELEREALAQMSRKERRRYAAQHRTVARPRHR